MEEVKAEDYVINMIFDTLYVTCPECQMDVEVIDGQDSIQEYLDATKTINHSISCESLTQENE